MAKKCVNLESPELKELHRHLVADVTFSDITPEVTGANIALWQERNNTDEFPALEQLKEFMAAQSLLPANEEIKGIILNNPIDVLPPEVHISQFEKEYKDPIERASRINLITGLFGQYVTVLIAQEAEERGIEPGDINRLNFIREYGPDKILREVKEAAIDPYVTNGGNVDAIWEAVESNFPEATEEEIEDRVLEIQSAYDKVSQYYWQLVSAARSKLRRSEGLKIKENIEQEEVENNPKEQFGVDVTTISGYESLSALSRHFLSTIPMMDQDGVYSLDDMLQIRYLESDFTYAKIVELLPGTKSSSEMIQRLEENIPLYPWLRGVVDRLSEDNDLATTLFSNMNKAFMPYDVITKDKQAVTLNINNTIRTFLNTVKRNLLSGSIISKDSIYNSASKLDKGKIKDLVAKTNEALKGYYAIRAENYKAYLEDLENRKIISEAIANAYRAIGFPVTAEDVEQVIDVNINRINPINLIWAPLQNVLNKVEKNTAVKDTSDMLQTFSAGFNNLSTNFRFLNQSTESSTRDGDKTRHSYVMPSYLSDLIDDIRDDSKREAILYERFKKYPFFFDSSTGRYYNDWLNILSKEGRSHMRANFRYKNVLHDDKGKRYSQWTIPDHIGVMLSEFGAFIDTSKSERPSYSGYMMPTMSDAETVLYLQAPRYDSDGLSTYEEKILSHLESVVYQEIIKINDIKDRAKRRKEGEDIPVIDYYDGHPEFTAIPQLNSYRTEDGKTFMEQYRELYNDKQALSEWIRGVLGPIVTAEFNNFMEFLQNNGVFSDNVGKFTREATGEKAFRDAVATLKQAILAQDPLMLEDPDIQQIFKDAESVTVLTSEERLREIEDSIHNLGETMDLDTSNIHFVSPLKDTLRHFFWNDYLANIYMIQMLTTSTQFYGSDVKFYKRGKEWYAATRKLDTDVKSSLRMAIVSDVESVVPEEYKKSIDSLYSQLIEDGKITSDVKGRLMKAMQAINETDGEAFMTLDAYRDMMLASAPELWTDTFESVYQKQTGKNPAPMTPEELGVIFQIIKPFVYTQIDMSNGGKDAALPLPFQNKNSIMVLTPSLVRNNPKLQGILNFMTGNSLDMLQFESAVKVGIQGKLNIEGNTSSEVLNSLNSQYLKDGQARDGYLYTIDARNFGIQQETPPHYLDAHTNIAVQMKRITQSYMSPEEKAEVDAITIANAKEAYADLQDLYTTPGKLYRMVSESLKDDGRATNDTIKAVSPDVEGNIPIPLCNPLTDGVITPRVIAPFKQIVKQMISGGALIQATSLGQKPNLQGNDSLGIKFNEDTGAVEYIECLMPATYKEVLAAVVNKETGELDIDAKDENGDPIVPEDMRRIIAFRIPSEGANSVIPLRIKGFLPASAGGMIQTNPLVFVLTGSDLDVDKLFFYKKAYHFDNGKMVLDTEGKTGRDNRYFDLIYKTITSAEYTKDMLNFSNFEEQKRAARIMEILSDPSIEDKYKNLSVLEKMSTKDLTALTERTTASVGGIASSTSKLTSAVRNMTGKNLIAMIANQSSNAVLLRDYPSPIDSRFRFAIDNNIFGLINAKNTYLAVKQYLAAVVDNAKDPVLGSLGANMDTINALMAMVRAGFGPVQIGLLFNQPSFKAALNEYEKSGRKQRLTKFILEYRKKLADKLGVDLKTLDTSLTSKELVDNINGLKSKDPDSYYRTQLKVLENLSRLFQVGDYLSEYVSVSRYDSANSAPSVSVESIYSESVRVANFYRKQALIKLPKLTEAVFSGDQALETLADGEFPVKYIQAMYGLSYGGAIGMLKDYYPQLNSFFSSIRNTIGSSSRRKELSNRDIKLINSAVMEYLLSERAFPIEQRSYFTEGGFEKDLIDALNNNPELDENYLLHELTRLKGGVMGIEDSGAINPVARERFTDAWRGLVMSDNPLHKRIGLDLLRYCAYTYGVKFAPGSFIHLAPLEAQLLLPGYVESLRDVEKNKYSDSQGFLPQFYLNNAASPNFVPQVPTIEGVLVRSSDEVEDGYELPVVPSDSLSDEIRDVLYPEDGIAPGAFKVEEDGKTKIYVRYSLIANDVGMTSLYKKVDPIRTKGASYSYGKSIEEFLSLVEKAETVEEVESSGNSIEAAMDAFPVEAAQYEGIPEDISIPFDIEAINQIEAATEALANLDFDAIEAAVNSQFDSLPEVDECNII